MRLKRLELQGFKSFLDRTVLSFDDSVTGVVGPNGCGKSNIVDAILWVMGEQSPKHLRGNAMTDVIFNGSEGKAAVSMAEVSLVLDKGGVPLAPQFSVFDKGDEIAITRRIYRDGSGEYLINKTKCRLKDIHELFMDTGVGRRAYSIIEQGQIDRMINVKPEDRRLLFEEVAGITKYKAKRREAERKLDGTRQNLLRLEDIVNELEKRIRSLKIQASRAQKYKELKSELETIDQYLIGRNLYRYRLGITELNTQLANAQDVVSEADATIADLDVTLTQSEVRRVDLEKQLQSLNEKERDLSLDLQRLESEFSLLEQQRKHLEEVQSKESRESEELDISLAGLEGEWTRCEQEAEELETSLRELDQQLASVEQAQKERQQARHREEERRDTLRAEGKSLSERTIRLTGQWENGKSREQERVARRDELNGQLTELVTTIESLKGDVAAAADKADECGKRRERTEQESSHLHSETEVTSSELSQREEELFALREDFHGKRSRLESLKELQENLEGYSPTARELLLKLDGESTARPLAELLQPEQAFEEVVEALLAADMNTVVVSTRLELEQLSQVIQEKDLERARLVAMEELPEGISNSPPAGTPLIDHVRVEPGFEKAASHWLAKVAVVENSESLLQLRTEYPDWLFISQDGRCIGFPDRSLLSGNLPSKTGLFARRREIDDLVQACASAESNLKTCAAQREELLEQLQEQEQRQEELKDRLSALHVERVEYLKEKEKAQLSLDRADKDYTQVQQESGRLVAETEALRAELDRWQAELVELEREQEQKSREAGECESLLVSLVTQHEEGAAKLSQVREERSGLAERTRGLEFRRNKITTEKQRMENRREELVQLRDEQAEQLRMIASQEDQTEERRKESDTKKNQVLVEIADAKEAFNSVCTELSEVKERLSGLNKQKAEKARELQEVEVKLAQEQAKFDHIVEAAREKYESEIRELDENSKINLEKLPLFASQIEVTFELLMADEQRNLLEEHLEAIKKKVSRYGEVNLTAIQEFEEIQQRYEFLTTQRNDLNHSIEMLEQAITRINESTRSRFEETFVAVNKKFKEIFPILFNGGQASLRLTVPDDILESGVDIMVQPPGKRLQSISLLSGGEKALTAVSLVLSIFARKPSPFCLLDEVDAPLDDANVSRFNTVIRKMAEKTQFIVITHNKKTMEITESLYGVTMERAGISKMTSVHLH